MGPLQEWYLGLGLHLALVQCFFFNQSVAEIFGAAVQLNTFV